MARRRGTDGPDSLDGTRGSDDIFGLGGADVLRGFAGDDFVEGGDGDDRIAGGDGFDLIRGDRGDDLLTGNADGDFVFGGRGDDLIAGDDGRGTGRGDLAADRLGGGGGDDTLLLGEGNDTATGGSGADTFGFRFNDPQVAIAAGTEFSFNAITDFDTGDDTLTFDVPGIRADSVGANFTNLGGPNGGAVRDFYSGPALTADGDVSVLTDQSFATGTAAAMAVLTEDQGDLLLYFNSTVNVASLLYVQSPDVVNSIARFTNIDSLGELQTAGFSAADFVFV